MRCSSVFAAPIIALLATGCIFQNVSAEERLRDAVVGYNDETRWNRIDLAQQRVAPQLRGEFRLRHHRWGRRIQVADLDILDVTVRGEDRDQATSLVQIRWYDQRTMIISESIVAQSWERVTGGYVLTAEEVRDGNPVLLEIPEELAPDPEGEPGEDEGWDEPEEEEEHASR